MSEKEHIILTGSLHSLIAPLLIEGKRTEDDIADKLKKKVKPVEVYYALERLKQKELLDESDLCCSPEIAALCHLLKIPAEKGLASLRQQRVFVQSLCRFRTKPLVDLLRGSHIKIAKKSHQATLSLIIVEDLRDPRLKKINEAHLKSKKPWLPVNPFGSTPTIGPWIVPGETACWECLRFRLEHNRLEETFIIHKKKIKPPLPIPLATHHASIQLAYSLASLEVLKWAIQEGRSTLAGKLISVDTLTSQSTTHHVLKRHWCPSCDKTKTPHPKHLPLADQKAWVNEDNGYHVIKPEETLRKFSHLISPITGIVSELTPLDKKYGSAVHVYVGGNNYAVSNKHQGVLPKGLRSNSSGKGKSDIQAKVSCLCESLERYSGIYHGYEQKRRARYLDIASEAVHPRHLIHYSETQYQSRDDTNKHAGRFHLVPRPFNEKAVIDWTSVWSLTHDKYKYVPTAFCYYAHPQSGTSHFFIPDSNGSASGNCYEEAILQGFFELVERDAIAIWWYNRIQRPKVDIAHFNDPYIQSLLADYAIMGREVWVIDITTDLNIPTFVALSRLIQGPEQRILMGFGTHLNPSIALSRALTEMNQMVALNEANVESNSDIHDDIEERWIREATTDNQPYLLPNRTLASTTPFTYRYRHCNLSEQLKLCNQIISKKGMEILVADQTRPDIGLHVVKVIVPGLRHFWSRYAPGRLYDIPVKLGWLKKPLQEHELNPIPMFL